MLKIINKFGVRQENGKYRYFHEVECTCGKVFTTRADGRAESCGCIRAELNRTRRLGKPAHNRVKSAEKLKEKAAQYVFKTHGYNDSDITLEKFLELSQMNCEYCNSPPSNRKHLGRNKKGEIRKARRKDKAGNEYLGNSWGSYLGDEAEFVYNGLDRIQPGLLHSLDNVVPCCRTCNFMKSVHSVDDFLEQVKRIYEWKLKAK